MGWNLAKEQLPGILHSVLLLWAFKTKTQNHNTRVVWGPDPTSFLDGLCKEVVLLLFYNFPGGHRISSKPSSHLRLGISSHDLWAWSPQWVRSFCIEHTMPLAPWRLWVLLFPGMGRDNWGPRHPSLKALLYLPPTPTLLDTTLNGFCKTICNREHWMEPH